MLKINSFLKIIMWKLKGTVDKEILMLSKFFGLFYRLNVNRTTRYKRNQTMKGERGERLKNVENLIRSDTIKD